MIAGGLAPYVSVALVDVAEVDPDGLDIDQHFPVVRRRIGQVPRLEHLGTTVTFEDDGSHDSANAASGSGYSGGIASLAEPLPRTVGRTSSCDPGIPRSSDWIEGYAFGQRW